MFRYSDTNQVSKSKEKQRKVVTKVRTVTYMHSNGLVAQGVEVVEEMVVSPEFEQNGAQIVGHKTIQVVEPVKRLKKEEPEGEE